MLSGAGTDDPEGRVVVVVDVLVELLVVVVVWPGERSARRSIQRWMNRSVVSVATEVFPSAELRSPTTVNRPSIH
jgi:hypothetical protein